MSNKTEVCPPDFRAIWAGDEPAHVLYRSEKYRVMAMLSPSPVIEGHTLVVPEQVVAEWHDLPPALLTNTVQLGQVVAKRMVRILRPTHVNLFVMGYRVPHMHMKVVPSYVPNDTMPVFSSSPVLRATVTEQDLLDMHRKLAFSEECAPVVEDILAGNLDPRFVEL